ncbi:capsule assembly Wzi family protein [Larkinella insperata]|uniref:Capsule assembly Wzi family protein n=1 Tax=Larkinella insperata TaxID=332158 RepID=A0ABW3Q4E8_9BACT|nr:capsule assembly Wzi family protein [Larkinella insperata]
MIRALLLFFLCPPFAFGQPVVETRPTQFFAELGGFYAPGQPTPFWMRTNQYGIIPSTLPCASLRAGVQQDYRFYPLSDTPTTKRRDRFGIGYGFELISNFDAQAKMSVLLPEAYVKVRAGVFDITAGRRREIVGLIDSTLSSGSYSWSGNALPMPKVQISLADYTPIGFTKGLLAFRGTFAHGWFGNHNRKVTHSYLHQKSLYARLGKPNWPVKFYAGFNHQAQWGGLTDELPESLAKNGRLPSRFQDYLFVLTGNSLGRLIELDTARYSRFDRENRIGNHLGSIDIGVEYSSKAVSLLLYHQSVYEDGSLYYLTNIEDGLTGLRFRNLNAAPSGLRITGAVVEFLYTKSQGGSVFDDHNKLRGRDNYFNHAQYRDGWSYFGRTIGTPFITPVTDTRPELSQYGFFSNNRVRAYHAGIQGKFATNCGFQFKFSYSQNYGTYEAPFSETIRQFSSYMMLELPLTQRGLRVNFSAAADQGDLFRYSNAVYAGIRKTWDYHKYRIGK